MTKVTGVDVMFLEHGEIEKEGRQRRVKNIAPSPVGLKMGVWKAANHLLSLPKYL